MERLDELVCILRIERLDVSYSFRLHSRNLIFVRETNEGADDLEVNGPTRPEIPMIESELSPAVLKKMQRTDDDDREPAKVDANRPQNRSLQPMDDRRSRCSLLVEA